MSEQVSRRDLLVGLYADCSFLCSGLRVLPQQQDLLMIGLRDVDRAESAALHADGAVTFELQDLREAGQLCLSVIHLSAKEELNSNPGRLILAR